MGRFAISDRRISYEHSVKENSRQGMPTANQHISLPRMRPLLVRLGGHSDRHLDFTLGTDARKMRLWEPAFTFLCRGMTAPD
jgi:hypothetical protein